MNPGVFVVLFLFSIVYIGECTISRLEYCGIQPGTNINYPRPPSNMTLLKVQVLMRHGDRLPHSTCWKNNFVWKCSSEKEERRSLIDTKVSRLHRIKYIENKNTYPGNCMMGQLTDYGWDQHVTNGKNLRNVYVNYHRLLNNSFDLSQFYIRSTDYARTIQSAQALLEGLYPSDTHRNIIEINTVDSQTEWMSPNTKRCPIVQKYMNEFYNSKTYEKRLEEVIKPLYKDVSNVLGIPIEDLPTSVADCFFAFKCHNADLPANATESLIKRLQENEEWIQKSLVSYPDPKTIGRLVSGELIFNVFDSFLKTIIGQKKEIFEIYSVHDTTIMPYLNALNSWDGKWTKYASTLIHELYKSGNDYFVRTLYNGEELLLSGCKNIYCNFEDYEEIVRPLIPNDIIKECKVNHFM